MEKTVCCGNADNFLQYDQDYINNAIPNEVRKLLKLNKYLRSLCFTASIDPMGTFGDCSHKEKNELITNLGKDGRKINVEIRFDSNNFFKVCLIVKPCQNISVNGTIVLKYSGEDIININFSETNFNKKQPLSIANTISYLNIFFSNNYDINSKGENGLPSIFVRKFLGDLLQAIESINHDKVYLGGDKPAAVMYYYLKSIYPGTSSRGGFVNTNNKIITIDDSTVVKATTFVVECQQIGGRLLLKNKKRRTNNKRNNKRKTNKRRNNKRKTNKRETKRRTNRRTNKKRTIRKMNTNRKKTNNRRRRSTKRRRRSIRKKK